MKPALKTYLAVAALVAGLGFTDADAQASSQPDDSWRFAVTPYLWFPQIKTTLDFTPPADGEGSPSVETGADDYLDNLDTVAMVSGEMRKGAWGFFTDVIYLDFSGEHAAVRTIRGPGEIEQTPVNVDTTSGLKGLEWQLAASYAISEGDAATFEVLGGVRYLTLDATVDWNLAGSPGLLPPTGSLTQDEELWDAIAGVRGRLRMGSGRWFVPYHLDAGTGSSQFTWQAMTGVGYAWKWGDGLLAYRYLDYDQETGKLLQDMSLGGLGLGVTFRF